MVSRRAAADGPEIIADISTVDVDVDDVDAAPVAAVPDRQWPAGAIPYFVDGVRVTRHEYVRVQRRLDRLALAAELRTTAAELRTTAPDPVPVPDPSKE